MERPAPFRRLRVDGQAEHPLGAEEKTGKENGKR